MDCALVAFAGVNTATEGYATARVHPGASRWAEYAGLVEHHGDGHLVLRGTFAGHYVDVDEAAHLSEAGAEKGWGIGALIGLLFGPPGFAVGNVLGATIGSQVAYPSEADPEPRELVARLRAAVPSPGSAVVLVADADAVDEMVGTLTSGEAHVTRRTLSEDELAVVDGVLRDSPPAAAPAPQQATEHVEPARQ